MNSTNNINPNGVSDGDQRVVPMPDTLNPNGGNDTSRSTTGAINPSNTVTQSNNVTTPSNVGVPGEVEPTGVEVRTSTGNTDNASINATDNNGADRVVVTDSVTHQAGEGVTAGMSPSMETPDIFDNSPQAAVKTQTNDQQLVDERDVAVVPKGQTTVGQQTAVTGGNGLPLETLSDGSLDIPREHNDHD